MTTRLESAPQPGRGAAAALHTRDLLGRLGGAVLETLQILGESCVMLLRTGGELRFAWRDRGRVFDQLIRVGSQTLPIASLVSLFIGMVLVVQAADQLANYTQEILGSIVGLSMMKELGPVVMGFLLAGRAGSACAAEIGSMSIYDEIAALRTMDIDPIRFLSMPRLIAMTLALPCLILYADAIGIAGGALVVAVDPSIQIGVNQYVDNLLSWMNFSDVLVGVLKGATFGVVVAVISCSFGFRTRGGSEGVAASTTAAVVWSFVLIIVFDYVIVRMSFLL